MRANPATIVLPILALCGGCELAGALIAAEVTKDDDVAGGSASLSVVVESASGEVDGRVLAPEMLSATGARFGRDLQFDLAGADGTFAIQVFVASEASAEDPYTGRPEVPATVQACDGTTCQLADDFSVEVVQTQDGRRALIDGLWSGVGTTGSETAAIALHFTEE